MVDGDVPRRLERRLRGIDRPLAAAGDRVPVFNRPIIHIEIRRAAAGDCRGVLNGEIAGGGVQIQCRLIRNIQIVDGNIAHHFDGRRGVVDRQRAHHHIAGSIYSKGAAVFRAQLAQRDIIKVNIQYPMRTGNRHAAACQISGACDVNCHVADQSVLRDGKRITFLNFDVGFDRGNCVPVCILITGISSDIDFHGIRGRAKGTGGVRNEGKVTAGNDVLRSSRAAVVAVNQAGMAVVQFQGDVAGRTQLAEIVVHAAAGHQIDGGPGAAVRTVVRQFAVGIDGIGHAAVAPVDVIGGYPSRSGDGKQFYSTGVIGVAAQCCSGPIHGGSVQLVINRTGHILCQIHKTGVTD